MNRTLRRLPLVLCLVAAAGASEVFQYAQPLSYQITRRGKVRDRESEALLWIPPATERVRGVVLAGMTLMEAYFSVDPQVRAACAERNLAVVFLRCGLGGPDLQAMLERFAEQSGYGGLASAPLCFVGHSAGGPQARARAVAFADRCFGLVQYRGGAPLAHDREGRLREDQVVPPGIPCLMMVGQFDEFGGTMRDEKGREPAWENGVKGIRAYNALDARNLGACVVEPGAGHFAWSERNATLLSLWLRKAAAAIEVEAGPGVPPYALLRRDPSDGWLVGLDLKGEVECAPYGDYRGDRAAAARYVDEELARAVVAYHSGLARKRDQFIAWRDRYWLDAGVRHFFLGMSWVEADVFEVHPAYADVYPPAPKGQGPRWARAGRPVGHSEAPISVKPVGGPLTAVDGHRFRIRHTALFPADRRYRGTFMAYSAGDAEYRYTERVGMMPRGFGGLGKGEDQTITFPELADLAATAGPVALTATSDAGLPVGYYVGHGPAAVVDDELHIVDLPARARFPITVEVVAYQFGSGVEPLVKTAAPVARSFRITAAE